MASKLPSAARAVVVGGGVIGNSVAYHLATMGMKDVVLLERDKLTSGTTWHAAGLMVTYGSLSDTSTEMRKYTKQLYKDLETETGLSTGLRECGFIELASNKDRLEEYRRIAAFNRLLGVDVEEISPQQCQDLFPLCKTDDIEAGFYVAKDGRANPVDVTMALAKGAKQKGVKYFEGVSATGVVKKNKRVKAVHTTEGTIECDYIVNCAGMWSRQFGAMAGVSLPLQAAEHYYLLTEPIKEVSASWPVIEDPENYGYYREEGGGLMVGLFEPVCAPWQVAGIPKDSSFASLQPDWDRMAPFVDRAMSRVPITKETGVKMLFCGPESFTPDLGPLVGEAPELKNYFCACGLNSIGILTGGGIGRVLAHWIINGKPDTDVCYMNVDRMNAYQASPEYLAQRTVENLGLVYACHYPNRSGKSARGARKPPFYHRMKDQGAYFVDVSGWESAGWYAGKGKTPEPGPLTWERPVWFPQWKAEHDAIRNNVALIDMSFMCNYLVQGRDAGKVLNRIAVGNVDGDNETMVYTQFLNDDGCIEADLTVTKLDEETFFVVATDTVQRHVETHLKRNTPDDAICTTTDVTSAYAQLNIQGPNARKLLQKITFTDLSNEAFPFRRAKWIHIGFARVLCSRITYVGELGFELFVPSEQAVHVYDKICEAGEEFGMAHAGLKALGSCRHEKAYRDWGHDMDNMDNILDAGLGFAVDFDKPDGFIGKEAVLKHKADGKMFKRRLVQIMCSDPQPLMYHNEPVLRNGTPIGYIRCASYGHTLGGALGLAMVSGENGEIVNKKFLDEGKWEVEIAGTRYPAQASIRPMFDPTNERIKC